MHHVVNTDSSSQILPYILGEWIVNLICEIQITGAKTSPIRTECVGTPLKLCHFLVDSVTGSSLT